jgi:hypothetical protein
MSAIGRAMLRLSACVALRGKTLAGENVYDSRIEAVDFPDGLAVTGSIAVRSEQDDGDALAHQNGGPPFVPEVELVLEIAMQARLGQEDGTYVVGVPETDDQLEMSLDIMETQAELALFRSFATAAAGFRAVAKRVKSKGSIRFTDPKASEKYAARYVVYKIEIDDPEIDIHDATATGLYRLPEPFRSVALAWPDASPEKAKVLALAALLVETPPPAFERTVSTIPPPPSTQTPGTTPNPPRVETWTLQQ